MTWLREKRTWLAIAAGGFGLGCVSGHGPASLDEAARFEDSLGTSERGGLEVQLAFSAAVDLDLYVSDPRLETVYYANTPSQTGGVLEDDARCKEATGADVRIERVHFERPPPGRYRVGVDFPEACRGSAREATFVLRIDAAGASHSQTGVARRLAFESRVLEFTLDAEGHIVP